MPNFFGSIFHHTVVFFVGLASLMGLVAAVPRVATTTLTSSTSQISVQQINLASASKTKAITLPTSKKSTTSSIDSNVALQELSQKAVPQQPVVNTPPPDETICNGVYYQNCSAGYNFVCPTTGGAYCKITQQQQQANDLAAQQAALQQQTANIQAEQRAQAAAAQQRADKISALKLAYNTQYNALQQQIINIKNQYYAALNVIENDEPGQTMAEVAGEEEALLNKDNSQISQIQLQEQQLYLNYQEQLSALQ